MDASARQPIGRGEWTLDFTKAAEGLSGMTELARAVREADPSLPMRGWLERFSQQVEYVEGGEARERVRRALESFGAVALSEDRDERTQAEVKLAMELLGVLERNPSFPENERARQLYELFCDLGTRHLVERGLISDEQWDRMMVRLDNAAIEKPYNDWGPHLGRPGFIHPDHPESEHLFWALEDGMNWLHPGAEPYLGLLDVVSEVLDQGKLTVESLSGRADFDARSVQKLASFWELSARRCGQGEVFQRNALALATFLRRCAGERLGDSQKWIERRMSELQVPPLRLDLEQATQAFRRALAPGKESAPTLFWEDLEDLMAWGAGPEVAELDEWALLSRVGNVLKLPSETLHLQQLSPEDVEALERRLFAPPPVRSPVLLVQELSPEVSAELVGLQLAVEAVGTLLKLENQEKAPNKQRDLQVRGVFRPSHDAPESIRIYLREDGWCYQALELRPEATGWRLKGGEEVTRRLSELVEENSSFKSSQRRPILRGERMIRFLASPAEPAP